MPTDPRTPVIVGVGQVTNRPARDDAATRTEPLALMAGALALAGEDAAASNGERTALFDRLDELTAIPSFVWHVADPALAVADALGLAPTRTRLAVAGGTSPQAVLFDAASRIAAGELDVAAFVGAESMRSRHLARRANEPLDWFEQSADVAPAQVVGEVPDSLTAHERALGMAIPVQTYALFEHALRRARQQSRAEHLDALDGLAGRMRAVAATSEHAWLRDAATPTSPSTPSPDNRMVSAPYTKLLASNVVVDMGAAVVLCSLDAARAAGVPEDRLVFPQAGATAREQWFVSRRAELSQSLAMRACAERLFGAGAQGREGPAHLDLYSCFPAVVQMAGDALGVDVWDDARAPTVTGGMTFFGGPGNNYVTHSLASMTEVLRRDPGSVGLVTALGWYCSTHAWATFATTPPATGFVVDSVQAQVDAVALRDADDDYVGEGEVESYTVAYDRDGSATRALVALRTPQGARRLWATEDPDTASAIQGADPLGAVARVEGATITLR